MALRLTKRRLRAMAEALSSMLAGQDNEGDWPEDLPREDLEAAENWVYQELVKKEKTQ